MTRSHPLSFALLALTTIVVAAPASAQDARGAWVPMFRGGSTHKTLRPGQLIGGLVPRVGRRTTLSLSAPGASTALLFFGARATTGVPVRFASGTLPVYVAPLGALSLPVTHGLAQLSIQVPNDVRLVGTDLAFQAMGLNVSGSSASNLLLANLGANQNGTFAKLAFRFSARAPRHAHNRVRVLAGDVRDSFGTSMPVLSNRGGSYYVTVIAILDRELRSGHSLELRTGAQRTGSLLGRVTKRAQAVRLIVPTGSRLAPTHVYLHNTDAGADLGVQWELVVG